MIRVWRGKKEGKKGKKKKSRVRVWRRKKREKKKKEIWMKNKIKNEKLKLRNAMTIFSQYFYKKF